jgi:hypothetical protein
VATLCQRHTASLAEKTDERKKRAEKKHIRSLGIKSTKISGKAIDN